MSDSHDKLVFRDAYPSEDDELARIMFNAFLPIWNHNWMHCITSPLAHIPSTSSTLTPLQTQRLAFYRSWFALVREHSGDVTIAYTPSTDLSTRPEPSATTIHTLPPNSIAAVVLLLPPHARPSWFEPLIAWRTGFLPSLFGLGLRGVWRAAGTFEGNVHRMITDALTERGIANGNETNLVFCQGCVRNPSWQGRAPARKLFDWAIKRYWTREEATGGSRTPIWLDTTTDEGVRAYESVGFEVVGECMVDTGADQHGIQLTRDATQEEREEGMKVAKQRVMIRIPKSEA